MSEHRTAIDCSTPSFSCSSMVRRDFTISMNAIPYVKALGEQSKVSNLGSRELLSKIVRKFKIFVSPVWIGTKSTEL